MSGNDPLGPRGLDVVDFDGDGDLDVFSTSEVGSTVCLHENKGGGSFGQAEIITNRANGVNLVTTIDIKAGLRELFQKIGFINRS